MENKNVYNKLEAIYENSADPGGYRSVKDLYKRAKEDGLKVKIKDIKEFLASKDSYTLHARAVYRPKMREKVVSYGLADLVQCDLADVQNLRKKNDNIRYLLVCIDVLSKKAYVRALKNKLSETVARAMSDVLTKEMVYIPFRIQTDKGTEFYGKPFKHLMKTHNIIHFSTEGSDVKASVAEVFIRELKRVMYKMITGRKNDRYIDDLQNMVAGYNLRVHPRTGFPPVDVTISNFPKVFAKLFPEIAFRKKATKKKAPTYKYHVGDKVRIAMSFSKLRHGYLPRYSKEVYVVSKILKHRTPTKYKLKTLEDKEDVIGSFASHEMIKIITSHNSKQ